MVYAYRIDDGIIKSHLMNIHSIGRQNFLFHFMFKMVKQISQVLKSTVTVLELI